MFGSTVPRSVAESVVTSAASAVVAAGGGTGNSSGPMSGAPPWERGSPSMSTVPTCSSSTPTSRVGDDSVWWKSNSAASAKAGWAVMLPPPSTKSRSRLATREWETVSDFVDPCCPNQSGPCLNTVFRIDAVMRPAACMCMPA